MTDNVIPFPQRMRIKSSSNNPTHIKKILNAGTKFENGIGSGNDRNAAEMTIEIPQITWLARVVVTGCLKVEILDVNTLNFLAAL